MMPMAAAERLMTSPKNHVAFKATTHNSKGGAGGTSVMLKGDAVELINDTLVPKLLSWAEIA